MNILWQIGLLFGCCAAGTVLAVFIPLPASVLSMLLLLAALAAGLLKSRHVEAVADFLVKNMAFFFLPVCVNVLSYLDIIGANLAAIVTISILSTILTFAATAFTVRALTGIAKKKGEKR